MIVSNNVVVYGIEDSIPERSKGFDSRSNALCFVGSNPTATIARLAQLVERKTFNLVVVGSSPTAGTLGEWRSGLAHVAHNHEVGCSIQPSPNIPL